MRKDKKNFWQNENGHNSLTHIKYVFVFNEIKSCIPSFVFVDTFVPLSESPNDATLSVYLTDFRINLSGIDRGTRFHLKKIIDLIAAAV